MWEDVQHNVDCRDEWVWEQARCVKQADGTKPLSLLHLRNIVIVGSNYIHMYCDPKILYGFDM